MKSEISSTNVSCFANPLLSLFQILIDKIENDVSSLLNELGVKHPSKTSQVFEKERVFFLLEEE